AGGVHARSGSFPLGLRSLRASFRRRTELLRPIDAVGAFGVVEEGNAHLREPRPHDVLAVVRALEPTFDDGLRRRDAAGDVLSRHAPLVAGARHALARGASIAPGVIEQV